jgi:hypothetical protein
MQRVTAIAKHLTLRNVPPSIIRALERARRKAGTSLNQAAIASLGRGLGVAERGPVDNGIGRLAGGWTKADLRAFEEVTAVFEQVDEDLWR